MKLYTDNIYLKSVKDNINKDIKKLLKKCETVILAGGAVKDLIEHRVPADYDIFFIRDRSEVNKTRKFLEKHGYELVFACPAGELFSYKRGDVKVQLILKKIYKDEVDLLESFDFDICCFYFDGKELEYSEAAEWNMKNKVITLNKLTYPVATINRLYKYRKKGYYTAEVIREIVEALDTAGNFSHEEKQLYID